MHLGELMRDEGLEVDTEREERREQTLAVLHLLVAVHESGPGPWAAEAACKGKTEVMFPERGASVDPARGICAGCPVLEPCRAWAETVPGSQSGVIAGLSGRDRRALGRRNAGLAVEVAA